MNAILLMMVCGVLAGLPAALLVFATDPRFCGDDDDDGDDDDEFIYIYRRTKPDRRAAQMLQSDVTQEQLFRYMTAR